jgi:polyhydroxybutyrate depolymerase
VAAIAALLAIAGACTGGGQRDRFSSHTLVFGGLTRAWDEYQPPGIKTDAPVVIVLAGYHEQPTDLLVSVGIDAEARRDGFTVVAPHGVDLSWNAGACCGVAAARRIDDVGFITAMIQEVVRAGTADPARVYLAGLSNGAMMAYRFSCMRPDLLAGAMVVEGTLAAACPVHRPVDLLVIHQLGDPVVPFGGTARPAPVLGALGPFPSVPSSMATWMDAMGCGGEVPRLSPPTLANPVVRTTVECPKTNVVKLDAILGGAHTWPQDGRSPVKATAEMAMFFHLRDGSA